MADTNAWNLGAEIAQKNTAARRERKEKLDDEGRKLRVTNLYSKGDALSKTIPSLTGPDRDKAMSALTDIEEQIAQTYHPDHAAPGALQKDWTWLQGLFGKKRPVQAPQLSTTTTQSGLPEANISLGNGSAATLPGSTYNVSGPTGATTTSTTPDLKLLAGDQSVTMPAAPATRQASFTPATSYGRRQQTQRGAARQKAEIDVAAAGLSPEAEAQQASAKNLAFVTQAVKDYAKLNPNATPEEKTAFFQDVVSKTYGFPAQRQVWKEYLTPDGNHRWGNAADPASIPPDWTAVVPGGSRGAGTDLNQYLLSKYGPNPTAEQRAEGKAYWASLGLHETDTISKTDAAGTIETKRVPVSMQPGAIAPGVAPAPAADTGGGTSPFARAIATKEGFGRPDAIPTQAKNPGALEQGDIGYGVRKAANGQEITVFPTEQAGWATLSKQQESIFSGRNPKYPPTMTLEEFGRKYSGGDANYGVQIATSLGVQPSTTLSELAQRQTPAAGAAVPAAGTAAVSAAPAVDDGGTPAAPIKASMLPVPVTPEIQQRQESLGLNPSDLIAPPDNPDDAKAALAEADRLAPGLGAQVLATAQYRMAPPATGARSGGKPFMDLVLRVNPAYDATQWKAVQQGRDSFAPGGKDALIVGSLELSVNHLGKLKQKYDLLDNGDYPDINKVENARRVHTGYGGVAAVDSAMNAVAGEMGKTFKGSSATDPEIDAWKQSFDHNMAPDAFHESVETMTDLMSSRLLGEAQAYVRTFGTLKGFPVLAPATVKVLKTIKTEGAEAILKVNDEAMAWGKIKTPAKGEPTTSPPPPAAKTTSSSGGGAGAGAGTITLSHAMEIYKQTHPDDKNVTKQKVINDLKQYPGQGYVDDLQ